MNTQKIPYLTRATHKKGTCQILLPKKIAELKISNPKKSFDHSRHLESGVPPPLSPWMAGPNKLLIQAKSRYAKFEINAWGAELSETSHALSVRLKQRSAILRSHVVTIISHAFKVFDLNSSL